MASTIRNTTVRFGLAEFPVAIRKASEKKDVKFEYAVDLGEGDFRKRQQVYVAAGTTEVDDDGVFSGTLSTGDNTVRGVWNGDSFVEVNTATIDAIMEAGQIDAIEIDEFVPLKNIPWERVEGAYYLVPQKGMIGGKVLRMLRDALKAEKVAGVAKLCLKGTAGRQKLAVIHEADGKVMVNIVAFADDFRDTDEATEALERVDVAPKAAKLARQLVKELTVADRGTLLTEARDETVAERERLYLQAIDGKEIKAEKAAAKPEKQMVDLEAALEASLAAIR
jgi:non-homologous end joining protein Ku